MSYSYIYTPSYPSVVPARARLSTSPREIGQLLAAYLVLTVSIAILAIGPFRFGLVSSYSGLELDFAFGFGAVAALTGFLNHELAHKVAAQRRGYWAEFRMFPIGLLLALVTSFVGFLFAMPGATVVGDIHDARDFGRTSLAGPLVNLVQGGAFAGVGLLLFLPNPGGLAPQILFPLGFFNGWFAAFNLLPFDPLDGRKVLRWNSFVWAVAFAAAVAFTLLLYLVSFGYLQP
ncbi:MAG TPA: site-2 protease family protein [Thermoplasmata archaeon]|nr:site-2 protease family protein [Thermoplasmata archaeon]